MFSQGDPSVDADYNAKIGQVEEALKKGDLFVVVDDVTYTAINMPDPAAPEPGCDAGEMDHNGRCGKLILMAHFPNHSKVLEE